MTHICVSKLSIIGSDNGLSPDRRQAIIWTNAGLLSIGPLRIYFNDNFFRIQQFSLKKMHVEMSSAKWRPSCIGLNVLIHWGLVAFICVNDLDYHWFQWCPDLMPALCQPITRTNTGLMLTLSPGRTACKFWSKNEYHRSWIVLEMESAGWRPFWAGVFVAMPLAINMKSKQQDTFLRDWLITL